MLSVAVSSLALKSLLSILGDFSSPNDKVRQALVVAVSRVWNDQYASNVKFAIDEHQVDWDALNSEAARWCCNLAFPPGTDWQSDHSALVRVLRAGFGSGVSERLKPNPPAREALSYEDGSL